MVFTSFNFLISFPILIVLYYLTPVRFRWLTLLLVSYGFYTNIKPVFTLLLLGVTLSTYLFTWLINRESKESKKKIWIRLNVIIILLPLIFFKYIGEINNQLFDFLINNGYHWPFPEMKLLLPIGISFYTFMAIGYTVDVYNEDIPFEKNPAKLALFISFFPLILSGPIERAKNMLPQFNNIKPIDYNNISAGLKLMLWGYFLKLVVADRIGIYVDAVYGNLEHHNGNTLLFTTILYPFQVYADLGGYSLIAIGVSKALGFDVIQNFNRPFFAKSMSDFWRRWHISLISWLTDYVYTPLSFSLRKFKVWGIIMALMLTFIISGIWHGASLTFVVWGLVQGVFLSIEALTNKRKLSFENKYKLPSRTFYILASILLTFILFAFSQIFGRATNIDDAFMVIRKIIFDSGPIFFGTLSTILYVFFGIFFLLLTDFFHEFKQRSFILFNSTNNFIRYLSYIIVVMIILLIGVFDGGQFIYFQF